ncbi:hypothetical protein, partial [Streptococcus pseudopneumoniae]|uniref:hypothetical protein n=1 Tax=Streptococcus pseudopneumoniae TaxID=257758 RepID=UPI0019D65320
MVEDSLTAGQAWMDAGADLLVFHAETTSVDTVKYFAETYDVTIGISALNDAPHEILLPYLEQVDYVQI